MENRSILHIPVEKKKPSKKDGPLEKETRRFNKLVKEIAEMERENDRLKIEEEKYREMFEKQVHPLLIEIAKVQVKFINKLEEIFYAEKFAKNVERTFVEFAIPILQDAAVYEDEAKEKLSNYIVWQNSISGKNNQAPAKVETTESEDAGFAEENYDVPSTAPDLDKKSMTELYKELAKQIHPDLEQNNDAKLAKEQLMKELTDARSKEDIYAMLLIRQKAAEINDSADGQNPYTLQLLKRYNTALNKKLEFLRRAVNKAVFESFSSKEAFLANGKKLSSPEMRIKKQLKDLRELQENLQHNTRIISNGAQLKELLDM